MSHHRKEMPRDDDDHRLSLEALKSLLSLFSFPSIGDLQARTTDGSTAMLMCVVANESLFAFCFLLTKL